MSSVSPHPIRILEIETFGRGGLIHYAYNLTGALAERGHHVTLITGANYELEGRPLAENVDLATPIARFTTFYRDRVPRWALPWILKIEAVCDALRVTLLARRLRPDLIHLHSTNPAAVVYLSLLRLLRRPVVITAHQVTPHEEFPFQRAVFRRIHRLADLVIAHSETDRRRLISEFSIERDVIKVIPHGEYGFFDRQGQTVDRETARRSLGLSSEHVVALFFGYIREYKGLDILLDAWPAVLAIHPNARLLIAGDPVQLPANRCAELESRASQLGAIHHFRYIPFAEVPHYFAAADVAVMPYRKISQSGILYLALALDVAVVATSVGGLGEVLKDGESALLIPPESPDELADALIRALGDEPLRRRLAAGGREIAISHSWPSIAEHTEAVFSDLVDRRN